MKKLITLFVVLFSINVIGQKSFNNYQSDVEKIILKYTTYKEATDILGKPDKVTQTEKSVVVGIELGGHVLYEYVNKGIRLICKDKNPSAVIEEILLKDAFKDTIQNGLFIGMDERIALKICKREYEFEIEYLNSSKNKNSYYYIGNRYDIAIYAANKEIVEIGLFKFETNVEKYGDKWGKLIDEGKIQLGMTKEMVEDSWGKPNDIRRSVGSWGVHEQWIYGDYVYIYIENDIVTSWQD